MASRAWAVTIATVLWMLIFAAAAAAATIYGVIQQGNQPVRNAPVVLACGGTEVAQARTDDRGNYRLTAAQTGRCSLRVGGASGEVMLYQEPTRYNFEAEGPRLIRR